MGTVHKILSNTIFHIISFVVCAGTVFGTYYLRKFRQWPFKTLYYWGFAYLVISFLIFLTTYKDKNENNKELRKESLSGFFFFASFFLMTLILRG